MNRGRRVLRVSLLALGGAIVLVGTPGFWKKASAQAAIQDREGPAEEKEWTSRLKTPEDVLEYIAGHRRDVSLAAWTSGQERVGIFLNPDQPRPLASTVKILVLAEYARQVQEGTLSADEPVSVKDWEAYWLPGTDGGAHLQAIKEIGGAWDPAGGRVALGRVARAMIVASDNAATDFLMQRLGRGNLEALPARLKVEGLRAPLPLSGSLLLWRNHEMTLAPPDALRRYESMTPAAHADEVWRLASRLSRDGAYREAEMRRLKREGIGLNFGEQADFARALDNRGTARAYAALMDMILRGTWGAAASRMMREQLEWPMAHEAIRREFETLGTKGGSLPGVLTSAYYAQGKGTAKRRVLALFFQNMPSAVWRHMTRSFVHQSFELKLLSDDRFFERVCERFTAESR